MVELKSPTTYEEQLELLKSRGIFVSDEEFCKQKLAEINYYRFTAYFLPFRTPDGSYKKGTSFQRVYRIYELDRKLRKLIFSAVEEVEIFLRAQLAYFHAHTYGAEGYRDPNNFSRKHDPVKFQENMKREINSNRKALFVRHHIEQYEEHFPIWVIVELFTFGMLSRFYDDLITKDKKVLARELYNTTPQNISSWLRCVTDLRNICAHYGRLYYRIFSAHPAYFKISEAAKCRLWGAILSLRALYPDAEKWNNEVLTALQALFEEYKEDIDLYHIAFPDDWAKQLRK